LRTLLCACCIVAFGISSYLLFNYITDYSYGNTPIESINKARGKNFVDYVIHEQSVLDGEIIFFLRKINDDQIVVSYEYVRKTWRGWKWIYGGGHSGSGMSLIEPSEVLGEPITYHFSNDQSHTEIGKTPFPMLHGIILNHDIKRVVVKDYKSGLERQAQIINIRDNFNLYFLFIDSNQGKKFDIITYNISGQKIYTKTIDEGLSSSLDSGDQESK